MAHRTFEHRSVLDHPIGEVFAWHERPGAFVRLTPPWEPVTQVYSDGHIRTGARHVIRISMLGPITKDWVAEHTDYDPPRLFRDVQVSGPFAHWDHEHRFVDGDAAGGEGRSGGTPAAGPGQTLMHDHVSYRLPLEPLGGLGDGFVRAKLTRMFRYRHAVLAGDLAAHAAWRDRPRRTVLITGATGLIGRSLDALLSTGGHTVRRLTRTLPGDPATAGSRGWFAWDPDGGRLDERALDGVDVVVHLSGENIAGRRWSAGFKQRLVESRLVSTALLAERMASRGAGSRPVALVMASGVNGYGDTGESAADESSPLAEAGTRFLSDLTRGWESAADPARECGVRVACLRIGAVLTPAGGALKAMLPAFMAGLGGPIGSGRQYLPWITLDDTLDVLLRAVMDDGLAGPVNVVSPGAVRQGEFARALGRALGRPSCVRAPSWAVRAALGEMAEAVLLASCRAVPAKLLGIGHRFRHADLESGLGHVLGRTVARVDGER